MPPEKVLILVVDDDPDILNLLRAELEDEGYEVITAGNGQTALKLFHEKQPSLVLLDIMLPDMDGFTVCRRIRQSSQVPIIMVTAKDEQEDKTDGLDTGANDYITKPFSIADLEARIRSALRGSPLAANKYQQSTFQCGDLRIDFAQKMVTIQGQEVVLTATEYKILSFLASKSGQVVSSQDILTEIWGKDSKLDTHIVEVNIGRLRIKLDDRQGKKYIENRPGRGYILKK